MLAAAPHSGEVHAPGLEEVASPGCRDGQTQTGSGAVANASTSLSVVMESAWQSDQSCSSSDYKEAKIYRHFDYLPEDGLRTSPARPVLVVLDEGDAATLPKKDQLSVVPN